MDAISTTNTKPKANDGDNSRNKHILIHKQRGGYERASLHVRSTDWYEQYACRFSCLANAQRICYWMWQSVSVCEYESRAQTEYCSHKNYLFESRAVKNNKQQRSLCPLSSYVVARRYPHTYEPLNTMCTRAKVCKRATEEKGTRSSKRECESV